MASITTTKYMSENTRIYKQLTNQLNFIKKYYLRFTMVILYLIYIVNIFPLQFRC